MRLRRRATLMALGSLFAFLLATRIADAGSITALTITQPGIATITGMADGWNSGFQFAVNTPIEVTSIGIFDYGGDGFTNDHVVGLWTDAGVLLASSDFTPGDPGALDNGFRYKTIPQLLLAAGGVYRIAASQVFRDADLFDTDPLPLETHVYNSAEISFMADAGSTPAGLVFPSDLGWQNLGNPPVQADVVGANFQFDPVAVPEPASFLLLGSGILARRVWRRRLG